MSTKSTGKLILASSLLIVIVLASGCCGSNASGDSYVYIGVTPTPAAIPTGSPVPTVTLTPSAPAPVNVTQAPSPTPSPTTTPPAPSPQNYTDPYSQPGWPTYGVNYTLVMIPPPVEPTPSPSASPSPTPTPTGTVHGRMTSAGFPLPSPTYYVYVTLDGGDTTTGFVDSSGYFSISGLSYGIYTVGYVYDGEYREYIPYPYVEPTFVIDASHLDVEFNLDVPM